MPTGTGTVPFDPLDWKLRGRFIDVINGRKVFAYACGETSCGSGTQQGRLIDFRNGKKVFAVASECRHAPAGVTPTIIRGCNEPFGIPSILLVKFLVMGTECFDQMSCPQVYLTHDVESGTWKGGLPVTAGVIDLEFTCTGITGTGTIDSSYTLIMSGSCVTGPYPIPAIRECTFPFNAAGGAPITVKSACCDTLPNPDVIVPLTFEIYGVGLDRYVGRLIDVVGGKKVFAIGECCYPENTCPVVETCCGCDASPRSWSFDIAGFTDTVPPICLTACAEFNGSWTVTYQGGCLWAGGAGTICTPTAFAYQLACVGDRWILETQYSGGAAWELLSSAWNCFGPNTMIRRDPTGTGCLGQPGSVTLVAA